MEMKLPSFEFLEPRRHLNADLITVQGGSLHLLARNDEIAFFVSSKPAPDGSAIRLYSTDGTPAGTRDFGSIGSATHIDQIGVAAIAENRVVFGVRPRNTRQEIWLAGGPDAGMRRIEAIAGESDNIKLRSAASLGRFIYAQIGDQRVMRIDSRNGSAVQSVFVEQIQDRRIESIDSDAQRLFVLSSRNDATTFFNHEYDLISTDGSATQIRAVDDENVWSPSLRGVADGRAYIDFRSVYSSDGTDLRLEREDRFVGDIRPDDLSALQGRRAWALLDSLGGALGIFDNGHFLDVSDTSTFKHYAARLIKNSLYYTQLVNDRPGLYLYDLVARQTTRLGTIHRKDLRAELVAFGDGVLIERESQNSAWFYADAEGLSPTPSFAGFIGTPFVFGGKLFAQQRNGPELSTATARFAPAATTRNIVSGTIFADYEKDGQRTDGRDDVIRGFTVWLDLDRDGRRDDSEPKMVTGVDGTYSFETEATGPAQLRFVPTADGQSVTTTSSPSTAIELDLVGGLSQQRDLPIFGPSLLGRIRGLVYHDINGDGIRQDDEPPVAGLNVSTYDFFASPGIFQAMVTTDAQGRFEIKSIRPKNVRVEAHSSNELAGSSFYTSMQPNGRKSFQIGLRNKPVVEFTLYNDANGNGMRDSGEEPLKGIRLEGRDNGVTTNGSPLSYDAISDSKGRVKWILNDNVDLHDAFFTLRSVDGYNLFAKSYFQPSRTFDAVSRYRVGLSRLGKIELTVHRPGEFGDDVWIEGRRVYMDQNRNGRFDLTEPNGRTNAQGTFYFNAIEPGEYRVGLVPLDAQEIIETYGPTTLNVSPGGRASASWRAYYPGYFTASVLTSDRNSSTQTRPLEGARVWLDLDDDRKWDADEPSVMTDRDGRARFDALKVGRYSLRAIFGQSQVGRGIWIGEGDNGNRGIFFDDWQIDS